MLLEQGKAKNEYSEAQKKTLIANLKRKYNLSEVLDYGASLIVQNFQRNIRAQIFVDGIEITFEVNSLNDL
ncbi:MAG: hypothetical protein Q7U47_01380 [Paludibacter sp.]|nr:hypothetical protein [Paludibacter sp.]